MRPETEDLLRLVDIGSRGGLHGVWIPHLERIHPMLFEIDQREVARLRDHYPSATVIDLALSNTVGEKKLFIK